jgi:TonB dependent receptor
LGTGSNVANGATINADGAFTKLFYGWYVQDDWKATRKLTLNLGLRYDIQTAPTDRFNRYSWFNFNGPNPISNAVGFTVPGYLIFTGPPNRRGIYDPQYTNFAPRVGLSYQATPKLVARAGFGMFYTPAIEFGDYQGLSLSGFTQNTPFVGTVDGITPVNLLSNPFPGGLILPPGKSQGALTNVGQATPAVENYRPTPYIEQWMAGLQYELTRNDALDVSYVGNHGVKLLFASVEKNQLQPQVLSMGDALLNNVPNPFYGQIAASGCGLNEPTVPAGQLLRPFPEFCSVSDSQPPAAFSSYNAFQITYNHRWSKGLQVIASFTASKYLDNAEGYEEWTAGGSYIRNNYNTSTEKSLNPDDIPKSFVLSYIYEIPIGRGKQYGSSLSKPLDAIVGGWQVSGITTFKSGFPLSITDSLNNTNSYNNTQQRPNLVGDPHVSNPTVNEWFNVNAFAQPPPFTFGNVGRYMPNLRAPGLNNWDLAIQKWWSWQEKLRIQFRAEMYNAFNHANFYAPDTNFADYGSTFGTITSANPAREFQMGLKLYF